MCSGKGHTLYILRRPIVSGKDDHIDHFDAIIVIVKIFALEVDDIIP